MNREIPFLSLTANYLASKYDFDQAVLRVIRSGHYILGAETEAFESEFARYLGVRHCVTVGSGLDAITFALRALNIGPGDEVLVPSHTYIGTWLGVTHAGATPVPVEPTASAFNMDPSRVVRAITRRTRALIPVHLYGSPAEMGALQRIAQDHELAVVEDCAQAHGARVLGHAVGTLGNAGAWSFYPTKNLGALGDGGAVTTNSQQVADAVRLLRNYGSPQKYEHRVLGFNSRLDEFQAAFLRIKLRSLEAWNGQRRVLAGIYHRALLDVLGIVPPHTEPDASVWHLYVLRVSSREQLQTSLRAKGVGTLIHYPRPPHLQDAYRDLGYAPGSLPICEQLSHEVLSLPLHPHMTEEDACYVADTVKACLQTSRSHFA